MPPHVKITLTENEARAVQVAIFNLTATDEPHDLTGKAALRADQKIADALRAKNLLTFAGGA